MDKMSNSNTSGKLTSNRITDNFQLLLLNVGLAVHNADWNWKNVKSPFTRIFYVVDGVATLHTPRGDFELAPDKMYMIPAFTLHSYSCHTFFRHYYMHVYAEPVARTTVFDYYDFPVEIPSSDLDLRLIKRLYALNPEMQLPSSNPVSYDNRQMLEQNIQKDRQKEIAVRVETKGILYQLISKFIYFGSEKREAQDERVQHVVNIINNDIAKSFTLEQLASEVCVSRDHLVRMFKKELGESPLCYINRRKMERAQLLLATDRASVKNISYMLGFDDHSYFTRLFKKITGVCPTEYRKIHIDDNT